jgi:2-amino-4-hydroxy-6-hydroxymethyldihydropteridine diphosphokinase
MPRIAFGLGSNMGESEALLAQARKALTELQGMQPETLQCSALYHTPALLPENAPDWWNRLYLNQVVTLEGSVPDPEILLEEIKHIEKNMGRVDRGRWSPREIDIDIIAVEGVNYSSNTLQIPHSHAHLRDFVLIPLVEIWEECVLQGKTAAQWLKITSSS